MADLKIVLVVLAFVLAVALIGFLILYRWRICCDIGKDEPQHQILRYRSRTISSRISVDEEQSGPRNPSSLNTRNTLVYPAMPVDPPPYEVESSCGTPPAYDSIFSPEFL